MLIKHFIKQLPFNQLLNIVINPMTDIICTGKRYNKLMEEVDESLNKPDIKKAINNQKIIFLCNEFNLSITW